jgi:uncharacterized circularly permuted ATP-grasp superfamily protein/uncharacterized alpha-E superfamily protein
LNPSQGALPFQPELAPGLGLDAAEAAHDLLLRRALPPESGVWDELREGSGVLRARWRRFAELMPGPADGAAPGEPGAELDRRVDEVAEQLRRDGVTHNVFGAGGVASRPWSLELLPLIVEPAEWAAIERGVVQRAELLEAMLADLYGPQRLLHEGLLPPALLLRHPGWLRPLVGSQPAGGQRLVIVAFDLVRGPEGSWSLVAQRTQGPSGLGYVLHNRLVIARQFPDAFRELRVQHIASSYRRLLDSVEQRARALLPGGGAPRMVLLTPGPYSETYFEHAYLARYLGLPLVEGGDLTVRGERLFLKTVEGLEPVHGVLRRVDDDWCDPLELRPDSALGVPGLLQAARAGHVVMANALGSAFLETPALQGFLPAISEALLGAPLALPSVPTWWCGEAAAWHDLRQRDPALAEHVVRSTFPSVGRDGGRTSQVFAGPVAAIEADPEAFTVQGRLRLSRAPIWGEGLLTPRPAMVRVYAIADGAGRWHVLPGGMTRVAQREAGSVSMQRGGTSLDTWVLTDGPVDTFSMLPAKLSVDDIGQRRRPVASRTGENLFWLGRYTERTEQLVRLARATLAAIDADSDATEPEQRALSDLAVRCGLAPWGVPSLVQAPHLFERAVLAALGDAAARGGACSIAFNLAALERASQALRDRLSSEHWGLIRRMRESFAAALRGAAGAGGAGVAGAPDGAGAADATARRDEAAAGPEPLPRPPEVLAALDTLALYLAAVTGAQSDRMTRDHGWRLLTVGRLTERLIGIAERLRAFLDAGALARAAGVELLLELFDSVITFRARYQRHEDLLALADLLVLDNTNPRSFAGVLRRLRTELGKLPGDRAALAPLLALIPGEGAGLTLESLRGRSDAEVAAALRALALQLGEAAAALADAIGERYFNVAHELEQRV